MKNILYTIILSFLFSSVCLAEDGVKGLFDVEKKSAEQGDAKAQFNLGWMYDDGTGVTQDYKEAAKWYRLAAEQGHAGAQYHLGLMYSYGEGVTKDLVIAHMWLNIAASTGNEKAKTERNYIEIDLSSERVAEAQKLARECVEKNYKDCG